MSSVNKQLLAALKNVRAELETLVAGDLVALSKIGAAIETLMTENADELASSEELLVLCLTGLQKIYEDETADFAAIVEAVGSGLVALEQCVASQKNAVCEAMLEKANEHLRSILSAPANAQIESAVSTNSQETEKPEIVSTPLETLNDVSALLMQIGADDKKEIEQICEALKIILTNTENKENRKLLVKAARDLTKILGGKTPNAEEILAQINETIGNLNGQNEFSETIPETRQDAKIVEVEPEIEQTETAIEEEINSATVSENNLQFSGDESLLKEFIIESRELVEAAEGSLLALENDPENIEAINTVFRAFHSVKGTSAFLGLNQMTDFAHLAESLLSRMRDREIRCVGGYADVALRSVDIIKAMLDSLQESVSGNASAALAKPEGYDDLLKILTNPEAAGISENGKVEIAKTAGKAEKKSGSGKKSESKIRIGDLLVSQKKLTREQVEAAAAVKGMNLLGDTLVKLGFVTQLDIEEALQIQQQQTVNSNAGAKRAADAVNSNESSVRVRTDRLDSLIDMVGELVIAQSMLAQDATVAQGLHLELSRKISHAGKIVRELQDLSMAMRMIPLKSTFQKMARITRDVAQKCGKQIEFVTEGEDTEIDRNMVDIIADPLVHMVRNAADHGIEKPDVREASGKMPIGKIKLAAYHAGGDVVVELADDGAGLNRDKILAKAVSLGLIESDKGMSENQIFNLIFAPGFSTVEQITDVSGRGVGMDVVKRNIEAMRGRIEISSESGKGSLFTIRLPLTLAITDGMLVRVGTERFIVPTINIQLSFRPTQKMLSTVSGRGELVSLRGELMPIFRLHKLFEVEKAIENPTEGLLMIVADGRRRCALMVDELLGQYQVVAKTLGEGIGKVAGVSGGAILGDGCVGLILDLPELVALARRNRNAADRAEEAYQMAA